MLFLPTKSGVQKVEGLYKEKSKFYLQLPEDKVYVDIATPHQMRELLIYKDSQALNAVVQISTTKRIRLKRLTTLEAYPLLIGNLK